MPSWKKVIVSGSDASLNSINVATNVVAQSFTGSLLGTASYATTATNVVGTANRILFNSATDTTTTSNNLTWEDNINLMTLGSATGTAGTISKIALYTSSFGGYGLGVSPAQLDYVSDGSHVFYKNGVTPTELVRIANNGDVNITGSLTVINGITGSLLGTASYANQANSASFATSASQAQNATTASYVLNAVSASFATSASQAQNANTASYVLNAISSSFATSASQAQNANTASYVLNAVSSSFASSALSSSYSITASHAPSSLSASYAITASYALFAANGGGEGGGGATVTHTQLTASTTWSFGHNLNTQTPLLQVYDLNYEQIIPNEIISINAFTSEIRFDYTQAGYAVASTGGGLTVTGSTPRLTQTVAATTWSFAHNLGTQFPGFEVFDQNDYVIVPAGIYAIDENNAEIYFATPSTGVAIANFSGINGVVPVATSASYATTASYAFFAATASYASNITISGSINDVDYINFDTNVGYTLAEGRLGWDSGEGTLQLGLEGGNVQYALGEQIYQYVYNAETSSLSKGQVVFISGSQGNRIAVKLADNSGDPTSAGTLGLVAEAITAGANGWVITEGPLRKLNTIGLTAGSLLYLGSTPGTYTQTKPVAPRHEVRVGYVERVHATVGSIYVKVDNGYEIGELHDVVDNTTTASYGDLLVKSGSVWHDSRQLTGSYGLTGSLQATSFTGSLLGTASFATYAATASYSDQFYIGGTQTQYATVTSSINGSNIVFNVATGSYSSAFFKYTVASASNARSGEIMSVWNGSTVTFTDNSTTDIGTTIAVTSSVAISASNAQLTMQTNTEGWAIKSIATFM